jgi:nucleoid-associated protein YgaU
VDQVYIKQLLKSIREILPSLSLVSIGFGLILLVAGGLFSTAFLELRSGDITPEAVVDYNDEMPGFLDLSQDELKDYPGLKSFFYVVAPGDSTWKLAEQFLGDGYKYTQIEAVNNLTHNSYLEIGQILQIDVDESVAKEIVRNEIDVFSDLEKTAEKVGSYEASESIESATYLVESGDSLWKIADEKYNDPYLWSLIYQENQEIIGDNPGLIYPDMELILPPSENLE